DGELPERHELRHGLGRPPRGRSLDDQRQGRRTRQLLVADGVPHHAQRQLHALHLLARLRRPEVHLVHVKGEPMPTVLRSLLLGSLGFLLVTTLAGCPLINGTPDGGGGGDDSGVTMYNGPDITGLPTRQITWRLYNCVTGGLNCQTMSTCES